MPKTKKIKIGIAGCGVVATAYYLPKIIQMENVELVAVCDIYPARTTACVRLFGAKEEYLDYYQMIKNSNIDAVFILTGPGTHVDFSLAALDAGIHVLIQKPMALDLEGAQEIARKTRETGLIVLVEPSSNTTLDPDVALLRSLIDQGVLGKPYWFSFFESRFTEYHASLGGNPYGLGAFYSEDSGGVLFDYPYAPSLIVSLLGPCKSVTGMARLSLPDRALVPEIEYDKYLESVSDPMNANYWDVVLDLPKSEQITMGAPDNVFSIYEMVNGFIGVFHVGRPFHPVLPGTGAGGLQIFGSEGNLIGNSIITTRKDLLPDISEDGWFHLPKRGDHSKAKWPQPVPGGFNYYHESTQHFIDCIQEGCDPVQNVEWGLHITEMLYGAILSSSTGKRYEMVSSLPTDPLNI